MWIMLGYHSLPKKYGGFPNNFQMNIHFPAQFILFHFIFCVFMFNKYKLLLAERRKAVEMLDVCH